ncbi:rac GTPase-activating protein 1-like isoform X2 [Sipha flava]|nr:rac GTPase-activating protein 1-like isoform X2 [Sipha flava]
MLKLKVIDELAHQINESENDKKTIKNTLEAVQDECTKLTYKLKTSARLLDEVQVEKLKLEVEKESLKSQIKQLCSVLKKPDDKTFIQYSQNNHSDCALDGKRNLNNTDALLSDISYSYSEDSSYENVIKNVKHNYIPLVNVPKSPSSNTGVNTKTCEIKNVNVNGGKIIATTTLTMDLDSINAKSLIKTLPTLNSKDTLLTPLSDSVESFSSDSEKNYKSINDNKIDQSIEKKHNFVQKMIVIPEICGQCLKKIKFNTYMVKCLDCKTIAHLECKDFIPVFCTFDENKSNALNCGVPPLIVYCINEIERRGMGTYGLYRVSGSEKEVKILRDKFRKGVPNLNDVDIHVLCSCLKDFIRTQKNHLIMPSALSKLTDALKANDVSDSLRQGVLELPVSNRKILAFLILHLQKVASSSKCSMDYNCLAIVFGPTIVGLSSTNLDDLQIKSEIVSEVLIELLKLHQSFWHSFIKADFASSEELLNSTPARSQHQTPISSNKFFSSGIKRRILSSPKKMKISKPDEFENN